MATIIVYLDDAAHALPQLAPFRGSRPAEAGPTHWVLVGCAPRMTQRVNKWVSHSARAKWRRQWAAKLFAATQPALLGDGDQVTTLLAQAPLPDLPRKLVADHGACRVLDARRPRLGQDLQPVTADQPAGGAARPDVPGAAAGPHAVLALTAR